MVMLPSAQQQQGDAGDEIVELRHVREHIVADDQVRLTALPAPIPGPPLWPKNFDQRRHPDFLSGGGHRIGRIDPEHGNTHAQKILEQVAVVAGQFDHQARTPQRETPARHVAIRLGMRQPVVRVRREIHVIAEQFLRARRRSPAAPACRSHRPWHAADNVSPAEMPPGSSMKAFDAGCSPRSAIVTESRRRRHGSPRPGLP